MRWYRDADKYPDLDDVRLREKFLWFPMTLPARDTDQPVTRWLERAKWKEKYVMIYDDIYWTSIEWYDI